MAEKKMKNTMNTLIDKTILAKLKKALQYSYSPYSKFKVAALLETHTGKFYLGCNIENSSFGVTICAERTAIANAVIHGDRHFKKMYIMTPTEMFCPPCGLCRQAISEFGIEIEIILVNQFAKMQKTSIKELLPLPFGTDNLEKQNIDNIDKLIRR